MWGLPGPTPRRLGGYAPPNPAVHYLSFECPAGGDEDRGLRAVRPKVNRKTAKTKVLDSFSQSVSIRLVTSLPLNLVLFLIYSLVVNDAPASGPVKGRHVSLGLSPGVRRTSVFANGENLGARRDSFPPRKSNLEGSPDSPQDWLGGNPKGASPLCVVVGVGYIGEGPHRKPFGVCPCGAGYANMRSATGKSQQF